MKSVLQTPRKRNMKTPLRQKEASLDAKWGCFIVCEFSQPSESGRLTECQGLAQKSARARIHTDSDSPGKVHLLRGVRLDGKLHQSLASKKHPTTRSTTPLPAPPPPQKDHNNLHNRNNPIKYTKHAAAFARQRHRQAKNPHPKNDKSVSRVRLFPAR